MEFVPTAGFGSGDFCFHHQALPPTVLSQMKTDQTLHTFISMGVTKVLEVRSSLDQSRILGKDTRQTVQFS